MCLKLLLSGWYLGGKEQPVKRLVVLAAALTLAAAFVGVFVGAPSAQTSADSSVTPFPGTGEEDALIRDARSYAQEKSSKRPNSGHATTRTASVYRRSPA